MGHVTTKGEVKDETASMQFYVVISTPVVEVYDELCY